LRLRTYAYALQALGPTATSRHAFLGASDALVLQDPDHDSAVLGLTLGC
jgi:hypothetical protein